MSRLRFNAVAQPSTPAASKAEHFFESTNRRAHMLDDKGVLNVLSARELTNAIRNSGFWFAQRQVPGTATTYGATAIRDKAADGWCVYAENASAQYRRIDTAGAVEAGLQGRYWGEWTKITTTGKVLVAQILEGHITTSMRGRAARLQAWMKQIVGATPVVRLALAQLTAAGTIDVIPSGANLFVTAANGNGVDPTLGASLSYLAPKSGVTPDNGAVAGNAVNCTLSAAWQRFGAVFDVPSDAKNLIALFFGTNQFAATNGFGLAQVSLTDGMEIQDWSPQPYESELSRCQRFYAKTFNIDTAPASSAGALTGELRTPSPVGASAAFAVAVPWVFPVRMRAAPTMTGFNPAAAGAQARNQTLNTDCTSTTVSANGESGAVWGATTPASTVVGTNIIGLHMTADAEI